MSIKITVILIMAFFLGSIPFAFIITKLFAKKDIRELGSGNPGATNVVRALNIKYGILVLVLDMAKGFIPVYFAQKYLYPLLVSLIALAIVIGHDYSPFLKFKGGRGVASSLGIFIVLAPVPTVIVAVIFLFITSVFKFVSLGSVMASFSYPIVAYLLGYRQYLWLAIILGGLIIFKHKDNLKRLWHGSEKRSI